MTKGYLIEYFGPFSLVTKLTPSKNGLAWSLVRWRCFGFPLPRWSTPTIECLEGGEGNRFLFDIRVDFPIVGHVIHYRGWLERTPRVTMTV